MRIGILADIHGDVRKLTTAIGRLRREQVNLFVVLGDVIYDSSNATETVALLGDCEAIRVWGNHELGLCVEPGAHIREPFTEPVMEFFNTLSSHLELCELLFFVNHWQVDVNRESPAYCRPV